jgi:subtilisin family serine protease
MYTVAFSSNALPGNVDKLVADAGGTIVVRLPQIGGIGVVSSSPSFAAKMSSSASVAASQKSARTALPPLASTKLSFSESLRRHKSGGGSVGTDPQPMPDPLGSEQWDKMRMNVSSVGSYAINRGRPEVRVAFTDTGVDQTHPDIRANLDVADSTSFVTDAVVFDANGKPVPILAEPSIQDFNGHGTWTASAVGAPINGAGISGVAPNVSIVALKTQDMNGHGLLLWFDQAVIYAAAKHIDIVSSSIDGYAQKCPGSDDDRKQICDDADYVLARRAVKYARDRGVLVVAAMGNDNLDLANDKVLTEQVFGVPGVVEVPGGLPGVIGVGATGYLDQKAYYSNYGLGIVDIAAPGGDRRFQLPDPNVYGLGGFLLGAWSSTAHEPYPLIVAEDCDQQGNCGPYAAAQGTSMATPNAAGVAALIVSRYGDFSGRNGDDSGKNNGQGKNGGQGSNDNGGNDGGGTHMAPALVEGILLSSASKQSCPDPQTVFYAFPPDAPFIFNFATCQGGKNYNGFYGAGIANAVSALTLRR